MTSTGTCLNCLSTEKWKSTILPDIFGSVVESDYKYWGRGDALLY